MVEIVVNRIKVLFTWFDDCWPSPLFGLRVPMPLCWRCGPPLKISPPTGMGREHGSLKSSEAARLPGALATETVGRTELRFTLPCPVAGSANYPCCRFAIRGSRGRKAVLRTVPEIEELLERLDHRMADDLEDQDLAFEEWSGDGKRSFRTAVEWAICMANGGGGAVVFGVAEGVLGRARAIRGVPPEVDLNRLKRAVYGGTDPKLTPIVEEIQVPEGTGRIVVMEQDHGYLERSGNDEARWALELGTLARLTAARSAGPVPPREWEAARARVEGVIRRRAEGAREPLSNSDVRRITGLARRQVNRLIQELVADGKIRIVGQGRAARYLQAG